MGGFDRLGSGSLKRTFIITMFFLLLAFTVAFAFTNDECYDCHSDNELTGVDKHGKEISLYVDDNEYKNSIHGDYECIECHENITELPHPEVDIIDERIAEVNCGNCHEDAAEEYQWHGHLKADECLDSPCCADCHGKHNILPASDKKSTANPINLPSTCGKCHEDIDIVEKYDILMKHPVESFSASIHGRAAVGGVYTAATCNDCHSTGGNAHKILAPGMSESTVNHFNIPKTCGNCHKGVERDYWEGIHGKLVIRGMTDSPVCTDCHGEHGILSPDNPLSAVSPARLAESTCSPCHESARLNEKYGVTTGRANTWVDSYHGLKSKAGDVSVANCSSCHGAHRILPSTDPTSSIYKDNLKATCGNCHPGISEAVANTPIHGDPGTSQTPIAALIEKIYIAVIIIIIGGMLLHWLIDLRKEIKQLMDKKQMRRMNYNEVWQHVFLMVTFITLVVTGFSLRFSEAWWVQILFGHEGGFPLRGIIHRVAAVLFMATTIWHVLYLMTNRGKTFLKDMFPAKYDLVHLWQLVIFNLGISDKKPRFKRFSYIEKAEYWALVWGTAVMIITGLALWFDNYIVKIFPKGFLDVMLVIHYYEAWLATLAILVWHLYAAVFNPSIYPMNPALFNGKMPVDMFIHEHPDDPEAQELLKARDSELEDKIETKEN
jgi:cytochrome b subunit of formate dehydrogenase